MDSSERISKRRKGGWPSLARWAGHAVALGALAVYSALLVRHRPLFVREIDSQAYFRMAQAYASGHLPVWPDDPLQFHAHPFVRAPHGRVTVKYPPGWPLCLAVGYRLGGVQGALWVNPLLGIAGAVAFWRLARLWFDETASGVLTLLWLFSPHLVGYVAYPLAHGASLAWALGAFVCSLRWMNRGGARWAVPAGFCTGFILLVRPTDALLWPALALAMVDARREARSQGIPAPPRKAWLLFGLAWLLPVAFYAAQNTALFGAPWRTGYALTREQTGFDVRLLRERAVHLWAMRELMLPDTIWLLGAVGLGFAAVRRPWLAGSYVLWLVPLLLVYGSYYWFAPSMGRTYTRFLLTGLPGVVLAGGWVFDGLRTIPWGRLLTLGLVLGWTAAFPPRESVALLRTLVPESQRHIAERLHPYLQGSVDFYSDVPTWAFHAGIYPGVRSVLLGGWTDHHWRMLFREAACAQLQPRVDLVRHAQLHEFYQSLGRGGLRLHVLQRIREAISQGRRVILAGSGHPVLDWLRAARDLTVQSLEPALWEIRRRAEASETGVAES